MLWTMPDPCTSSKRVVMSWDVFFFSLYCCSNGNRFWCVWLIQLLLWSMLQIKIFYISLLTVLLFISTVVLFIYIVFLDYISRNVDHEPSDWNPTNSTILIWILMCRWTMLLCLWITTQLKVGCTIFLSEPLLVTVIKSIIAVKIHFH